MMAIINAVANSTDKNPNLLLTPKQAMNETITVARPVVTFWIFAWQFRHSNTVSAPFIFASIKFKRVRQTGHRPTARPLFELLSAFKDRFIIAITH